MTGTEIYKTYRDSFEREVLVYGKTVNRIERDIDGYIAFECPCGQKSHVALMNRECLSFTDIMPLHCYFTGRKWAVVRKSVQDIIYEEELAYGRLIESFGQYEGKSVSAKEAFVLVTSRGVPADMLEIQDTKEFDTLMDATANNREKSG